MSLTVKEVRNPIKRTRAEKILALLESNGPLNEYDADLVTIDPDSGVAMLSSDEAGLAMSLADGTVVSEQIHLKCLHLGTAGVDTIVVTPANLTAGTTITFTEKDHQITLIWVGAAWTARGGGSAAVA